MNRLPISACIIAKNSEEQIERCLASLTELVEEIILVDTGSHDKTPLLAKQLGAKVYHFEWVNNFSKARNEAFKFVSQPWSLIIDTDEELVLGDFNRFHTILSSPAFNSFFIYRVDILNQSERASALTCRVFRTAKNYRYQGIIHETANVEFQNTASIDREIIFVRHFGYNTDFADPKEKSRRNTGILKQDPDYKVLDTMEKIYNAIALIQELDKPEDLLEKIELLGLVNMAVSKFTIEEIRENIIILTFFQALIQTASRLGDPEMEEQACIQALDIFPDELNLLSMTGECYFKMKNFRRSLYFYNYVLELVKRDKYLKGIYLFDGTVSYGTLYNIALCHKELDNPELAIKYLEEALKVNPEFEMARTLLGNLVTSDGEEA
jgi:glycosyltransferase involved in cell wall biosynthesis